MVRLPGDDDPPRFVYHDLVKVCLPDGRSLTRQPDGIWLTEAGQRLRQVISHLEEDEYRTMAMYCIVAW